MTYQEAITYLFSATPVFQQVGGIAYKPGLERMQALDAHYGHPSEAYQIIHVGGTNGKGSTSHTLAAILQCAGYRVGLFTSPHLIDFRERIRVNGEMISEEYVCAFTEDAQGLVTEYQPSFFELTCAMAFSYFREQQVDIAVVEVGLGGRLDCTNIVRPILSIITNISLDHTQYLGDSLESIAKEKAGIIKTKTPIVIGSAKDESVRKVFEEKAKAENAPMVFAEESGLLGSYERDDKGYIYDTPYGAIRAALAGEVQVENTATILTALAQMEGKLNITNEAVRRGFAEVVELTGLRGRWETLQLQPRLVCDTGHNEAGIRSVLVHLERERKAYRETHIILGMASDKDVRSVLQLFPRDIYHYYFTQASVPRALPADELRELAEGFGLIGESYSSVSECISAVLSRADSQDLIFVGGSNFVVADLLSAI